jgi:serine protease Do
MPTPRTPNRLRLTLMGVLLAGTALGGLAVSHTSFAAATTEPAGGTPTASPIQPQPTGTQLPDFSNLVTQVKPAVVSITNHLRADAAEVQGGGEGSGGMLPFPFGGMMPNQHPRAVEARGSGFIIDADGIVVTNNHVVKDARTLEVTLDDGTQLPAKVIGTDPRTDIAVLKVSAGHKLPFIQLGESNDVKPGQWVVAMGNPFGLGGTVTAGIVSARGRDIGDGPYDSFIQVDAPINQGNSGGPLFTQDGKVVGINTAILSPTGGSVGIGFAIPSDTVKTVVAQLQKGGHVTRGFLGVEAQQISGGMAKALHIPSEKGALVAQVQPNSPAAKAGLQPGDVITSVNGQTVTNPRDLAVDIAGVAPDAQANLQVVRNGQNQQLAVTVARLDDQQSADNNGGNASESARPSIGVALAPLDQNTREQFDLPADAKGALIARVQPNSPAAEAGLRPGDLVVGVDTKAVGSASEAAQAIRGAAHDGHTIALRIIRNGQAAFVAVDPAAAGNTDQSDNG